LSGPLNELRIGLNVVNDARQESVFPQVGDRGGVCASKCISDGSVRCPRHIICIS
jgi:hypothetical protein